MGGFWLYAFGVIGYLVVGAVLEDYDRAHGTDYLSTYTLLVLLTAVLAQREGLARNLPRIGEVFRRGMKG